MLPILVLLHVDLDKQNMHINLRANVSSISSGSWSKWSVRKGSNGETGRMVRALKHLEGGRERIVKCKERGSEGQTYWQRMRGSAGWGGLGRRSVRGRETDRREEKSRTHSPHLDMVLRSAAQKLLMWHEERELAFQRREKCLLVLLLREKGWRYAPHISSLFGDFAVASTFYLSLSALHLFFIFLFIPFVLNSFPGHSWRPILDQLVQE